ncbi:MAG: hypothetical protein NPIRA04_04850 [Nitrospirales bacterium]|nr:MAG: hypothetical protein NPIRA04_04850 [Nitrospirales bacterium]
MSLPTPNLDDRNFESIVAEAKTRIQELCPEWTDFNPSDPGITLVELMAWMMESTIYRLNKVPEKALIQSLELLGITLQPPQSARAWVTFATTEGVNEELLPSIPAGTRLIARNEDNDSIPFSTVHDLNLSSAQFISMFSYAKHKTTHHFPIADGEGAHSVFFKDAGIRMFEGTQSGTPCWYFGDNRFKEYGKSHSLRLQFSVQTEGESGVRVEWEVWDGAIVAWTPVIPDIDETLGFRRSGNIVFESFPIREECEVNGRTTFWLRSRLLAVDGHTTPSIVGFEQAIEQNDAHGISVEKGYLNYSLDTGQEIFQSLDLTKEFLPFGKNPQRNTVLYFKDRVFGRRDTTIRLLTQLSDIYTPSSVSSLRHLEIQWEYYSDHDSWQSLGVTTPTGVKGNEASRFVDETRAFTQSGTVQFECPSNSKLCTIGGEEGYYVRAILIKGSYGEDHPNPPVIAHLLSSFTEHSRAWPYSLVESEKQMKELPQGGSEQENAPFAIGADDALHFYLAFNKRLANKNHCLFFQLENSSDVPQQNAIWEYEASDSWKSLSIAADQTNQLVRSGMVEFLAPTDWAKSLRNGIDGFWLRLRFVGGHSRFSPTLYGIHMNTTEVIQSETIKNEDLGSSQGSSFQMFSLKHRPVQEGTQILVREASHPSVDTINWYRTRFGSDAVLEKINDHVQHIWIRWTEVPNFLYSGSESRHYLLDMWKGVIRFGDGKRGKIPPAGPNNIRAQVYFRSMGAKGNVQAHQISELDSLLSHVAGVTNPFPSEGGIDGEKLEEAKLRGPWMLKSRDRAVTKEDFVVLAKSASREVGLACCIPSESAIEVLIIPRESSDKPNPSIQLTRTVEDFLNERRLINTKVKVTSPEYVDVIMDLAIVLVAGSIGREGEVRMAIEKRLRSIFHPIYGGNDGQGWPMGRSVYYTDMVALVEQIEGVDFLKNLTISNWPEGKTSERILVSSNGFPFLRMIQIQIVLD